MSLLLRNGTPQGEGSKVNFDASWKKDQPFVGIVIVIRNYGGDFYAAMCWLGPCAEFLAAHEAVYFALNAGFRHIVIEGDNLSVIKDGLSINCWGYCC